MTDKVVKNENDVRIGIEQIVASILSKFGPTEVTLEQLLEDYSNKSIAVNQDPETKNFIFELTDIEKIESEK